MSNVPTASRQRCGRLRRSVGPRGLVTAVADAACWRALLTARRMVLNKRRDIENGIRALLREVGLKVGTPSRKDFPARVRELAADDPVLMSLAGSLLSVIEVMTREVERLTKRAIDEVASSRRAGG